ncbi:DUF2511 domain-containing protein [Escherichia coli]
MSQPRRISPLIRTFPNNPGEKMSLAPFIERAEKLC